MIIRSKEDNVVHGRECVQSIESLSSNDKLFLRLHMLIGIILEAFLNHKNLDYFHILQRSPAWFCNRHLL